MALPGAGYHYTHQDINGLMLFPWPSSLPITVNSGQIGHFEGLSWRQYLAVIGEHWEKYGRYPHHALHISAERMTITDMAVVGQVWGLAVRALVERGYLNPATGALRPPVPFTPAPPEYPVGSV